MPLKCILQLIATFDKSPRSISRLMDTNTISFVTLSHNMQSVWLVIISLLMTANLLRTAVPQWKQCQYLKKNSELQRSVVIFYLSW